LDRRLRLKVNAEKSAVARPWERKFLGYSLTSNREPRLKVAKESSCPLHHAGCPRGDPAPQAVPDVLLRP
ncbi:MAG: hypothetical protein WAM70_07045, partial [Pyrinomonadaceae bacterium]